MQITFTHIAAHEFVICITDQFQRSIVLVMHWSFGAQRSSSALGVRPGNYSRSVWIQDDFSDGFYAEPAAGAGHRRELFTVR
ncbi:hypothetical protein [Rhodanobacter sp. B04]|uniref:hypothetical protein n=1 Tax=Rhodanobacter sp. B04 TaxID=1945860 RepID=UPI001115A2F9|nr:hypothetical protein [Rhodanobacter sp. B04]